jgi:hypothetical protein
MLKSLTIVAKSYLPNARVLMSHLRENDPNATLYVFLSDQVDGLFAPEKEPFEVITPDRYVDRSRPPLPCSQIHDN